MTAPKHRQKHSRTPRAPEYSGLRRRNALSSPRSAAPAAERTFKKKNYFEINVPSVWIF